MPLPTYPPALISGQIPPTYLPFDVTYYLNGPLELKNKSYSLIPVVCVYVTVIELIIALQSQFRRSPIGVRE
eukprot:Pgem_evm1s5197